MYLHMSASTERVGRGRVIISFIQYTETTQVPLSGSYMYKHNITVFESNYIGVHVHTYTTAQVHVTILLEVVGLLTLATP